MGTNSETRSDGDAAAARLRALGKDFFTRHAFGDADDAFKRWQDVLSAKPDAGEEKLYRELLAVIAEVSDPSVRNYLHHRWKRYSRIGRRKRVCMDGATTELGRELPVGSTAPAREVPPKRRPAHLAVFLHLKVPSQAFHFAVLSSLVHEAQRRGLTVSVHDLPEVGDRGAACRRVLANLNVDLAAIVRVTPDAELLEPFEQQAIPVALIHAERQRYPYPVVAHIVSTHEHVAEDIRAWHERKREHEADGAGAAGTGEGSRKDVVIVAMAEESPVGVFDRLDGIEPCIRNERRKAIADAVDAIPGLRAVVYQVPGYSHRHAIDVFREYPDAYAYIALSDPIAIELKHLLQAVGQPWRDRVIGHDDSEEAADEQLSSFNQRRDEVGEVVIKALREARARMLEKKVDEKLDKDPDEKPDETVDAALGQGPEDAEPRDVEIPIATRLSMRE